MRQLLWHGLGLVIFTWVGLAFSLAQADEAASGTQKPSPAELARWVKDLDSDVYAVREAATDKLVAAGTVAIDVLAGAVLSDSAEVAWRAGTSLQRIAVQGDEATLGQVSTALQKLSSQRPALTKLVSEIKVQQQKYRHKRAIAKVRGLGGNLSGNWEDEDLALAGAVIPALAAIEVVEFEAAPAIAIVGDAEPAPAPAPELAPAPAADPFAEPKVPEAKEEEAAPPARGIFGVLARLFAPREVPVAPDPEPAPAPAEVEAIEVADAIAIEAFAGPVLVDELGEGESEAYAELVLDQSFKGKDADLALLKDIPEIYSLTIQGAKLTDKSLAHIAELKRLTTLNVRGTDFSSAALRKLRQKRPELSIVCRSTAMLGINAGLEGPCVLSSVFHRSGAADAGLREGDEIIEVDGQKVRDFSDLTIAVYPHKPGDKLNVKFRRSGEEKSVEVVLKPRVDVE